MEWRGASSSLKSSLNSSPKAIVVVVLMEWGSSPVIFNCRKAVVLLYI